MQYLKDLIIITHNFIKSLIFYIIVLIKKIVLKIIIFYNYLEVAMSTWAQTFIDYSFLKFLSFLSLINDLWVDVFSFEHKLLKTYFFLLIVVIAVFSNASDYTKNIFKKLFFFLFTFFYLYVVMLFFSIILLIFLHLKNVSYPIILIFIRNYHSGLGYKLLTFVILVFLLNYYFVNKITKKVYLKYFLILIFSWFTNYFIYRNFDLIEISKLDPCIDLFISWLINWLIYEVLYFFFDKTDPEAIRTYQKWDKRLDRIVSYVFIEKLPIKWVLFIWFTLVYIFFILIGLF